MVKKDKSSLAQLVSRQLFLLNAIKKDKISLIQLVREQLIQPFLKPLSTHRR